MPRQRIKPLVTRETNGKLTAEMPLLSTEASVSATKLPDFDTVATAAATTTSEEGDKTEASTPLPVAPKKDATVARQTHGASFSISGPITNVQQLIGRRSVAKGSMGSFENLSDYREHIEKLTLGELHAHSIDSMVTPIYDRATLLTRLEREWTAVSSRVAGRGAGGSRPNPNFTAEQNVQAAALLKKMQRR